MSKRAVIVHGWDGHPSEGWFPWLKEQLEERGYQVTVPAMPDSPTPKIEPWVTHLAQVMGEPTEQTLLVGHSIGCQTILRYLETLPESKTVGTVILVAPFLELLDLGEDEDAAIAAPWLATPIDYLKVRGQANKFVAIFSDNDQFVPLANVKLFQDRLGAETLILPGRKHFSGSEGTFELPKILEYID